MTLWSTVRRHSASILLVSSSRRISIQALSTTPTTFNKMTFLQTSTPVPSSFLPTWMKEERTRTLTPDTLTPSSEGVGNSVVYWMQRDVRTVDNWALLFAAHLAQVQKVPLHVIHVLPPPPPPLGEDSSIPDLQDLPMTERHGTFYLGGLQCAHDELAEKSVSLHILRPLSHRLIPNTIHTQVVDELSPCAIVCDFSPLRHVREMMEGADFLQGCESKSVPVWQVDAHNIVPVWHAADKRQVGARTLRPKINKVVQQYLQKFPKFTGNAHLPPNQDLSNQTKFDYESHESFLAWDSRPDMMVPAVKWAKPGTDAAKEKFESFIKTGLSKFDSLRNDPNYSNICSGLSPWINHGHISFQRCLMAIKKLNRHATGSASYIEEGLIRRELSDNYLFYTPGDYDKLTGAAGWAQETLQVHASDKREYVYTMEQLETSMTHDDLWNAAQLQVVTEGKMHGFLRMYWAKKILEWTSTPEEALETAQYFNDKYALDGRDPNGFVGVGWSIMGIHDMGWKEREIFGKIRFMNYNGCKRKFKVQDFVQKYKGASENAMKAAQSLPTKKTSQTNKQQQKGKKRKAKA